MDSKIVVLESKHFFRVFTHILIYDEFMKYLFEWGPQRNVPQFIMSGHYTDGFKSNLQGEQYATPSINQSSINVKNIVHGHILFISRRFRQDIIAYKLIQVIINIKIQFFKYVSRTTTVSVWSILSGKTYLT